MSDQHNRPSIPARRLPVRPNLDQLKHKAKELLRAIRRGEPEAIEEFNAFHPKPIPVEAEGRVIAEEAGRLRSSTDYTDFADLRHSQKFARVITGALPQLADTNCRLRL